MLGLRLRRFLIGIAVGSLSLGAAGALFGQTDVDSRRAERLLERARRNGSVRVIVGFQTQQAFTPEGRLAGAQAVRQQRNAIARGQRDLRLRMSRHQHSIKTEFATVPFTAMEVDAAGLADLIASGVSVEEDALSYPALGSTAGIIRAPQVWNQGVEGTGQAVAILDTGVEAGHSFLGGRVIYEGCFSSTVPSWSSTTLCPNSQDEMLGPGAASPAGCSGVTGCDHGTHVAGIAAGSGGSIHGVARQANIMGFQVFSRFTGSICGGPAACVLSFSSDQVAALEQVYALRNTYDIAAANLSLGGGQNTSPCDGSALAQVVGNLKSAGIATVISSGNNGYTNATTSPGCISAAVTVGATEDDDDVPSWSNSASFVDLLAPGVSVQSSVTNGGFSNKSGTSMAAPQVTGAFALLKSANPTASVDDILGALQSTGVPVTDSKAPTITKPRIKLDDALAALGSPAPTITTASLPDALAGTSYSVTVGVSGGANPLQFSILSGTLPTGLAGPNASGVISGTPSQAGAFPIRVRVTDNQNQTDERDFTLNVTLAAPILSTPANTAVTNSANVTFSWLSVVAATQYDLTVTRAGVTVLSQSVAGTSFASSNLPDGTLQWHVRARTGTTTTDSITFQFELDTTPPAQIALNGAGPSLPYGSIQLNWIAPGDNGTTGRATSYDIRYAPGGIINFANATQLQNEPAPASGLTAELLLIQNLLPDQTYTVAMTTTDNAGNVSSISNPVVVQTRGIPPEAIGNLQTTTLGMDTVRLTWSAPHEDGNQGDAVASYEIRYATFAISEGNFLNASLATNPPNPGIPGSAETKLITGLTASTTYYFAVRSADLEGNVSAISNVPQATTTAAPDTTDPGPVTALQASPSTGGPTTLSVVDSSGEYSAQFAAALSIDGDLESLWSSPPRSVMQDEHVTFDLGVTTSLQDIRLRSRSSSGFFFPVDFVIELSNDGQNYQTASSENGFAALPATWYSFPLNSSSARYVRVRTTRANQAGGAYFVQIAEVEVTGISTPGVLLSWVSSGDDGGQGNATEYDIRYQLGASIDFPNATEVLNEPVPSTSGSNQSHLVAGLTPNSQYTFGVQAVDEAGNRSPVVTISHTSPGDPNIDTVDPGAVTNFMVSATTGPATNVSSVGGSGVYSSGFSYEQMIDGDFSTIWSTPGRPTQQEEHVTFDLGAVVSLDSIRLRSRANSGLFFPVDFVIELSTDGAAFQAAHTESNFVASAGTWYTFATGSQPARFVKIRSTKANQAGGLYYVQITEFQANGSTDPMLVLSWISSGDDGSSGAADSYDIRYSAGGTIQFGTATTLDQEPAPLSSGSPQSFGVPALDPNIQYTFGIQVKDEAGNVSPVTTVTNQGGAADTIDPGPATSLQASPSTGNAPDPSSVGGSGTYGAGFGYDGMLDGNLSTLWSTPGRSAPQNENVTFDLGSLVVLEDVRLASQTGGGFFFPVDFAIELSTDGTNFQPAHSETNFVAGSGTWYTFPTGSQPARYLRIQVTKANQAGGAYYVQIADVQVSGYPAPTMLLSWNAGGDDGAAGTATSYDIRYQSGGTLNFANAIQANGEPVPQAAGSAQSFAISGLMPQEQYTFGIQAIDEAGNQSIVATITQTTLADPNADTTDPGPVTNFAAAPVPGGALSPTALDGSGIYSSQFSYDKTLDGDHSTLWSTPGRTTPQVEHVTLDLGSLTTLDDVRLATRSGSAFFFPVDFTIELSMDGTNFQPAHSETNFVASAASWYTFAMGSQQARFVRVRVTKANQAGGTYYVQIADFEANGTAAPAVSLFWTAGGDDGSIGTATEYDIRYAVGGSINFSNAAMATGEPTPSAPGTAQSFVISGLTANTQYTIGIQAVDEAGNRSAVMTVTQIAP